MPVTMKALAGLSLFLASGACYRYTPVTTVTPGMDVRARFTTEAAVQRSRGLDEPVIYISGRVIEAASDSLRVDVLVARESSQFLNVEIRDTMTIPNADLAAVMVRELSTTRSILFAGALGAGAFLVVKGISVLAGGNEGDQGDNGDPALVVPVFSVRAARSGGFVLRVPFQ